MPDFTPLANLRKPLSSDAPDGSGQIGALADDADAAFGRTIEQTSDLQVIGAIQTNSSHLTQLLRDLTGRVSLSFSLILTSGTLNDGTQVLRLPAGFRPRLRVFAAGTAGNSDFSVRTPAGGWCDPDGYLYCDSFGAANITRYVGSLPLFKAYS
jgi:hypothetical protein